tara:strand:- start:39403 stop:39819 length:417 start_codon:yes stop_codon:yes gene_type:complete
MPDLFKDILPSILVTKKDALGDEEGSYVPFIINRALSYHYDCILPANDMNQVPHLPKAMQYQYHLNKIRAWKRPFQKWQKLEKNDDLDLIKERYGYSNDKARAALEILSKEQVEIIREEMDKGGFNDSNKRSNRGDAK